MVPSLTTLLVSAPSRVVLSLLIVFSVVCTQVPLFNYLGFEFSALLAVLASFLSGFFIIVSWNRSAGRADSFDTLAFRHYLAAQIFLLVPLVIMSGNAFVVKNCSLLQGFVFFALLPLPAVAFSSSIALVLVVVMPRWRKTVFTLLFLVILSQILIVTFATPQIFTFNPFIGFFPGITYDESLSVEGRLAAYRVGTLAASVLLYIVARVLLRHKEKKEIGDGGIPFKPAELMVGAGLTVLISWLFFFSNELGLSSSRTFIQQKLGGSYETDHFLIYYPREKVKNDQIERIARLHEFYFAYISRELRVLPEKKIQSYIYGSPEQKGRLIGAAGTDIAKPWLWQLHINLGNLDRSLKHELVHVMAADFGFPLLRISLNSGLIEGLAVAVERIEYDETLHRLAAQIQALGQAPDVRNLFTFSGFFKVHGGTSYALAGSFCRYLIDQYGIRRFKSLYRTGNFRLLYNKDLDSLVGEWNRFISHPPPAGSELHKAAYLFKRPSIFGKECARVIADLNTEARNSLRAGRYEEALLLSKRSLELTKSSEGITLHVSALTRLRRYSEAAEFSESQLKDSALAHTLLPLYLTMGDALWSLGRIDEARSAYRILYGFHLGLPWDEAAALRTAALADRQTESTLRDYFVSEKTDSGRVEFLRSTLLSKGAHPLYSYLLARELLPMRKFPESLELLQNIKPMNAPVLEFIRYQRIARAYFETKSFQKAKAFFWESLNFTTRPSHQIEVDEWVERCDWMEENSKP